MERPTRARWQDEAACKGRTTLFYSYELADELAAKALCAECPVNEPCRDNARQLREFGVWGGESEVDRARSGRGNRLMTGRAAKAHYGSNS